MRNENKILKLAKGKVVSAPPVFKPVSKTIDGLTEALFDELNLLRSGGSNWNRARAAANLGRVILEAKSFGREHEKLVSAIRNVSEVLQDKK